jgi:aspartyl-tRNA(Asn)/glutamyl-tRNA(Gln) amidotransferase subunit B
LLQLVDEGKIAFSVASQSILPAMFENVDADPQEVAVKLNLIQDAGEDEINEWVKKTLDAMPEKVSEYRKGKKGLIGLFVGEVKKISGGKADPRLTTELLNKYLNNHN